MINRETLNRETLTSAEIVRILEASGYLLDLDESGRAGNLDPVLVGRLSSLHADVLAEKEDRAQREAERKKLAAQVADPEAEPGSNDDAELASRR